jgi:outer membrane protein OmpA-like peptidoglycan-associated protein
MQTFAAFRGGTVLSTSERPVGVTEFWSTWLSQVVSATAARPAVGLEEEEKMEKSATSVAVSMAAIFLLTSAVLAQPRQKDVGKDHPLLDRFPGSVIVRHKASEFDALVIPLGEATGIDQFSKSERVEGAITRITYEMPEGHSTAEVFQSYRDALRDGGFEVLYACEMNECGNLLFFQNLERPFILRGEHRYVAAKADLPRGQVYVTVRVYTTARQDPPVRAMVNVAETRRMKAGLVKVNADAMADEIAKQGHVALYGIYFDTDKAEIKSASRETLAEMATFLSGNPTIKIYIVGHTDNVGTVAYNMQLSQRRAEAVVKALVTRHGVDAERVIAKGVGPLAPVASNHGEEGRARNRRVELVAQ